tara:strand:+ start:8295 stop:9569 length:1275 start_codon:yes stop_codon:yes gene_type:complete
MTKKIKFREALKEKRLNLFEERYQLNDSFYVIDLVQLYEDINILRSAFNKNKTKIAYSYKTNYLKPIIKLFDQNDIYSEVVSPFEVDITKSYRINPKKIIYNGPIKDKKSVQYVLQNNGLVNADSFDDLNMILNATEDCTNNKSLRIGVRFSFLDDDLKSRFGIEYTKKNIIEIFNILKSYGINHLSCLHIHFPERTLKAFQQRVNKICSVYSELKKSFPLQNTVIDIGGGLPSKLSEITSKSIGVKNFPDLCEYSKVLKSETKKFDLENVEFIIEPGTALISNSMHIIGNVYTINKKKDSYYINTDLSRNLIGGLRQNVDYPISIISQSHLESINDEENKFSKVSTIAGYSCVEKDKLRNKLSFPENLSLDSKVLIESVGSYSHVFKSPFIRGDVAVFTWNGDQLSLSKRKQTANDLSGMYLD